MAFQVRKLGLQAVLALTCPLPPLPATPLSSGSVPVPDPGPQQGDLLSLVSEGRRDQCEAPSDPKFPDCSGKVEVRPGAVDGTSGDQKGGSSMGAVPQTSSGVPLLVAAL